MFKIVPDEHGAALFLPTVGGASCTAHMSEQLPEFLDMIRIFVWEV